MPQYKKNYIYSKRYESQMYLITQVKFNKKYMH